MSNKSSVVANELLVDIVKEKGVAKIILDYKKEMENICVICENLLETHHYSRCRGCGKLCCPNNVMEHEINCDFD